MSKGLRNILQANSTSPENAVTVIFVNQLRMKIGVVFGNPEVRPGGKALPFYSFLTLDVRASSKIEGPSGNIIGHKLKVKVVKSKSCSPHKSVELDLIYGEGICKTGSLLDAALFMKVVTMSGAYYKFEGEILGQGRSNAIERLKSDPTLAEKLTELTRTTFEKDAGWLTSPEGSETSLDDSVEVNLENHVSPLEEDSLV